MPSWLSLFNDRITACNPDLAKEFQHWLLPPGTCFQDERLWWGERRKRTAPHEGLDLVRYADRQGAKNHVAPGLRIPAIFSGRAVRLHQDFLNQSLYIRHDQFRRDGAVLHTVYGHVQPEESVRIGREIGTGESAAVLAAYPRSTVPLHLHLTVAWIPEDIPPNRLSWRLFNENERIIPLDPSAKCGEAIHLMRSG